MKYRNQITHRRLLEVLDYDPLSGKFRWKQRSGRGVKAAGVVAGSIDDDGRRVICIDYQHYFAHRLAWFYVNGGWPQQDIDHKNLKPINNGFENLRQATTSQNNANTKARCHNRLGIKGVRKRGRGFIAQITINKKLIHLGSFKSPTEANAAYLAKAQEAHGEFARGE